MLTEKEKAQKWERMQAINKRSFERRQARLSLTMVKAIKAGIVVTDAEVDAEITRRAKLGKVRSELDGSNISRLHINK